MTNLEVGLMIMVALLMLVITRLVIKLRAEHTRAIRAGSRADVAEVFQADYCYQLPVNIHTQQYTTADGESLTHEELERFRRPFSECPDCGASLVSGPSGGMSQNVKCADPSCGSRFNDLGIFGVERISDARPLAKEAKGG